ncbi:protein kinase [Halobacillus yeomjeoni]|uniref:protein kinase domain-containing protein n=1 Tax=Halobacillus yeomjeoni TaxID=311194 RepID=UPI001CD3B87C|nr:protein kinase [Halobacillus yeomjeoni]MCA0985619.1 protein kinase [Halobacillus yeomjeoni]
MKKQGFNLYPGSYVRGKWSGHGYIIEKELGSGACGTVFLSRNAKGEKCALKIGSDSSRLMLEVNMLKKFGKVQGVKLGPSFVDVDDWVDPSRQTFPFYVMEYIEGAALRSFLKGKSREWVGICALQLLSDLEHLHRAGYAFGDLKTDNLLMVDSRVRLIDVGGVTQFGRAIKEYTEFYDRGYWGLGSRKADPSYDLFAVSMIMLEMAYPGRFEKGVKPSRTLMNKLTASTLLKPYQKMIIQCWEGKYLHASEMKHSLSLVLMKRTMSPPPSRRKKKQQQGSEKVELVTFSILSVLFLGVSIFSFWI